MHKRQTKMMISFKFKENELNLEVNLIGMII